MKNIDSNEFNMEGDYYNEYFNEKFDSSCEIYNNNSIYFHDKSKNTPKLNADLEFKLNDS
jgi:hypothetical protein